MPNFEALLWEVGNNNDGGLSQTHYYALPSWFTNFPEVPSPNAAANITDLVTISENFVFHTDKFWLPVYCTLEKGKIESKQVGERDGKSYENTVNLFFPGSKVEGMGWMEQMKNTNFVMLIRELEGQVRVIGSKRLPAEILENSHSTGEKIADLKGFTYSVKSIGRIAPVYTGEILTQEGVIPSGEYEVP